jgi:hypothetical protein
MAECPLLEVNYPRRIAHGGRLASASAGDTCGEVYLSSDRPCTRALWRYGVGLCGGTELSLSDMRLVMSAHPNSGMFGGIRAEGILLQTKFSTRVLSNPAYLGVRRRSG